MADIVTFDPDTLRIIEINPDGYDNELNVQEIYSEWKDWLLADQARLAYPQAFRYVGADPISETQSLGTTYFLINGWRIRPSENNHRLTLVGNLFTDPAGDNVDVNTLGTFNTRVNLRTSNLIDLVTAGGGSGEADWTTTERSQIRQVLGIIGTKTTPEGGGHIQDIRTPVQANLDTTVSSRATPGAEMDLIAGTITDIATQVDSQLSGTHGSGSWLSGSGGLTVSDIVIGILDAQADGYNDPGTIGERINRIDTTVSSRATAGAVWDEIITNDSHNIINSAGRRFRLLSAFIGIDGYVDDVSATTTSFITSLTETDNDFYKNQVLVFESGSQIGQAKTIIAYNGTSKTITLEEPLTNAPADTDRFIILTIHAHTNANVASAVFKKIFPFL